MSIIPNRNDTHKQSLSIASVPSNFYLWLWISLLWVLHIMSVPLWLCYYFTCDNVLNIVPFVAHISTSGLLTANTSPLCVYTMCILYSQHYPIVCVPCVHPTANTIPLSVYSMCALYSQHYPTVYIYHVYTVSRLSSLLLGHFSGFNFLAIVRGSEFLISIPLAINLQVEL